MQAQRKFEQPAHIPEADAGEGEGWATRLADLAPGQPAASPAHLLWEELAARLQPGGALATPVIAANTAKWPMPARIATVVGLSAACWTGIYMAVAAVL